MSTTKTKERCEECGEPVYHVDVCNDYLNCEECKTAPRLLHEENDSAECPYIPEGPKGYPVLEEITVRAVELDLSGLDEI